MVTFLKRLEGFFENDHLHLLKLTSPDPEIQKKINYWHNSYIRWYGGLLLVVSVFGLLLLAFE